MRQMDFVGGSGPATDDADVPELNAAAFHPTEDDIFARIATRYGRLCDIFSFFVHRLWKRHMASRIAAHGGKLILDVASGTGDIPVRAIAKIANKSQNASARQWIVSDLCPEMLNIARERLGPESPQLTYALMDAHTMQGIASDSIDLVSISFAMKICDRQRVLAEALRVLKPGGTLMCLEAARIPFAPLHVAYLAYMRWCMPLIGRLAANGDKSAYAYLLQGVHSFPDQESFADEMRDAGFTDVAHTNLTLGVVALHEGVKPGRSTGAA